MGEVIGSLPALAGLIEKAGVIGLLVIVCAVLAHEVFRLRKELTKQYGLRDTYRTGYLLCKAECDRAGLKPDLNFMNELMRGEAA